jgi:Tfp pilus assembly protein PilN
MSQVNLLPPEIRERQKVRQRTVIIGAIGGAVLLLILGFYFLQTLSLNSVNEDLGAQEQTNQATQAEIAALARFGELQDELSAKRELRTAVYADEIAWSGVLVDISRIIPTDAVLTSLSAQITPAEAAGDAAVAVAPTTSADLIGTITYAGKVDGIDTLAAWLARLGQVRGWVNPFSTSATEITPRSNDYDFASTVDLTRDALTPRGRGEEPEP